MQQPWLSYAQCRSTLNVTRSVSRANTELDVDADVTNDNASLAHTPFSNSPAKHSSYGYRTPSPESCLSSPSYATLLKPVKLGIPRIPRQISKNDFPNWPELTSYRAAPKSPPSEFVSQTKLQNDAEASTTSTVPCSKQQKAFRATKFSTADGITSVSLRSESSSGGKRKSSAAPYVVQRRLKDDTFGGLQQSSDPRNAALPLAQRSAVVKSCVSGASSDTVPFQGANLGSSGHNIERLTFPLEQNSNCYIAKELNDGRASHSAGLRSFLSRDTNCEKSQKLKSQLCGGVEKPSCFEEGIWEGSLPLLFSGFQAFWPPFLTPKSCERAARQLRSWVPRGFPSFHFETTHGCVGVNVKREFYFTFRNGTPSRSSEKSRSVAKSDLNRQSKMFFVIESRGTGCIRVDECKEPSLSKTSLEGLTDGRWDAVEGLPVAHRFRFWYGWWLLNAIKATIIRVELISSQGWIARRTYSSFALPLVLFSENWKMPSILSSSWCFYLQIPVDCQQRYLAAAPTTVSLKTATLEPLIVLMQATGLGSIHTSNGAIVQHFAPNGKLVFEASEHQAPAAEYQEHTRMEGNSEASFSMLSQVIKLSMELFSITYALELKQESTLLTAIQKHIGSRCVGTTPEDCERLVDKLYREESARLFPVIRCTDTPRL